IDLPQLDSAPGRFRRACNPGVVIGKTGTNVNIGEAILSCAPAPYAIKIYPVLGVRVAVAALDPNIAVSGGSSAPAHRNPVNKANHRAAGDTDVGVDRRGKVIVKRNPVLVRSRRPRSGKVEILNHRAAHLVDEAAG